MMYLTSRGWGSDRRWLRQVMSSGKLLRGVEQSIELDQDGQVLLIPHVDIAEANLVYRFSN